MRGLGKSFASFLVVVFMMSLIILQPTLVSAQTSSNASTSAPAIQWQQHYGNTIEFASNLIQTSDGGFIFMDLGWVFSDFEAPATIYKVDSLGNLQLNKTVSWFTASEIIQTSDGGYEISGYWHYASGPKTYLIETPTLIKMDSEGNIQWVQNYTKEPNLGVPSSSIKTSDGGFVYWSGESVTKTDSNNDTQWIMNLTYPTFDAPPTYTYPLTISSVIETSNGSLAVLGVGYNLLDNHQSGKIYLITTEPFLPLPSQSPLPTPLPSPTQTPTMITANEQILIIALIAVIVISSIFLLIDRKHRKTANLKQ
jgi:hypothetical protein